MKDKKIAIIGSGPIGLETALYASQLGYEFDVFEKGEIASNILRWGHVTLFSPWHMNHSKLGVELLHKHVNNWREPDPEAYLTGKQHVETYLLPISRLPQLSGRIHTNLDVLSIGRQHVLKSELIGNTKRASYSFKILTKDANGREKFHYADIIIDATGVFGNPNWLGEGGIPALGEMENRKRIEYHLPDLRGCERSKYAGKKTLVIGSGYSAATTVCDFAHLIREKPKTSILWITRGDSDLPLKAIENDPLPNRAGLTNQANDLAHKQEPGIEHRKHTTVEALTYIENEDAFLVRLNTNGSPDTVNVDRIIANVGYGPDNSLYKELQVHECYATKGPMKLAATLLGSSSGDCLTQTSMGAGALKNPEPNFYIIGNKSYGRNPTFLIRVGLSQVVDIFSLITGDSNLNLYEDPKQQPEQRSLSPDKLTSDAGNQAAEISRTQNSNHSSNGNTPYAPLHSLDTLWFQAGGTICNLWCTHCFISCSPENHTFGFMERATVQRYLEESKEIGVKEYYFTGGEPFMNRDMLGILEDTLAIGPATVLTNGILISERVAKRLKKIVDNSRYSLELRVSIDGFSPETNDAIRGKGSFEKAMKGVKNLVDLEFLPIITAAQTWDDSETDDILYGFRQMLTGLGYTRPRIKLIPPLRIGREKLRSRGYDKFETITKTMMLDFDTNLLQCTHSRMVTDKGVYVCPILIDYPEAKISDSLKDSGKPFPLKHQACYTCYISGAICHNVSAPATN
ncbi:MAG: radical SAM protein [bacterium]